MKIALPQFHYMVRMEKQPDPKVNEPAHNCVVTYVDGLSANDPRYEDKTAHPNWFVRKSFISPPREVTGLVTHEVTDELGREYLKKTANECISLPDQLQEKEELLNMMHYCNELGRSALHLTANNCEESAAAIRSENPWMLETALENANTMMGIQQNLQQTANQLYHSFSGNGLGPFISMVKLLQNRFNQTLDTLEDSMVSLDKKLSGL